MENEERIVRALSIKEAITVRMMCRAKTLLRESWIFGASEIDFLEQAASPDGATWWTMTDVQLLDTLYERYLTYQVRVENAIHDAIDAVQTP